MNHSQNLHNIGNVHYDDISFDVFKKVEITGDNR
ncbi:MAG: hypothetical protein Greene041679_101 [Parcubacteria group bacterium Greene0416_79]|nr:MAG: hypothetical protein Greene041679_101 [Parcubacteria group bacterium Greene0416_79]